MMVPGRLLLISSSAVHPTGYLDAAEGEIRDFLGREIQTVLFVPYALHDLDGYARKARERFEAMGYAVTSVHESESPAEAVAAARAIFIGGGNTFRLLDRLHRKGLVAVIRERVSRGMPYVGASAGSNVACPTIKTTKDMPIVQPPSFEALSLVDFQISPHYQDPDPRSTHMGETQEERILQYLEENDRPVAGLREGAILRIEAGRLLLKGSRGARLFRRGDEPLEVEPGADVTERLRWAR
jgi:dipeptidase E